MNLYAGTFTPNFVSPKIQCRYSDEKGYTFTQGYDDTFQAFASLEAAIAQGIFQILNFRFKVVSLSLNKTDLFLDVRDHNNYAQLERFLFKISSGQEPLASVFVHTSTSVHKAVMPTVTDFKVVSSEEFYIKAFLYNKHIHIKKV